MQKIIEYDTSMDHNKYLEWKKNYSSGEVIPKEIENYILDYMGASAKKLATMAEKFSEMTKNEN